MLNWLMGELLLGQVEANRCYHEAEKYFERALEVARRQRTKVVGAAGGYKSKSFMAYAR